MFTYLVYGLVLQSDFPVPELTAHEASAVDVVVRRGSLAPCAPPDAETRSWVSVRPEHGDTLCVFEAVGRFSVREGREILVEALPDVDFALVRHALVGPVLAQLMWQRDLYTLHASVVQVGMHHVGFIGVSGEGKSTTAAALQAQGHALVCDDIAVMAWQERPIRVRPGFARIRLYADSLRGIGDDPERHPLVHSQIDKRLTVASAFVSEPVCLDRVYVLATGPELLAELLPKREAMMELMRHTYSAYQHAPIVGFAKHMQMAAQVAEQVPVYRLSRPKDLSRLSELVGFLRAHVGA